MENDFTFLEINFRNSEGNDRHTIAKVPLNWNEAEIRSQMMNNIDVAEVYSMYETICENDDYGYDFT